MFIYKISLMVEGNPDTPGLQADIDEAVKAALISMQEKYGRNVEELSWEERRVDGYPNLGRCTKCGAWASDWRETEHITEVSNGAVIDGKWCCDLCLPEDHPNHF